MFDQFDPAEDKMLQVIDNNGKVISKELMPKLSDDEMLKLYKDMLFVRTLDHMIVSYQRQGRVYTYPPNYGQEAIGVAAGAVLRHEDWLVPAFRELGAWLAKGATMKDVFMFNMGFEEGTKFAGANHMLPSSVPIASQLVHAAGIGYAIKYQKKDEVAMAFVGDGGTSEGDFHEALNFAGVWKVPVIFVVQNNQYAISVPVKMQTASVNIAIKSKAYGIKGIKVDGNDLFAMLAAFRYAHEYARKESQAVLIEAVTYRKGAHTTSDDPTKYRTTDEEKEWDKKDPLRRMKLFLEKKKLWSDDQEKKLVDEYEKEIDRQFIETEQTVQYPLEDAIKYTYAEMPQDLRDQQIEHEKFLQWKNARK
ncbi:MAG: pyruvate dehydrogenase (acetyl-transferring) E1 component subunit alpha [Bacteroidales bacterium]|jgi:pyruvate dehydrogenase E1 component alpha subunit|nr:pyruvate dehydrogenase (acetyl-transferring) E1 component subunit alpha [Bacteroidales bacterium]MCB9028659.1 pyruvate dehydrogenase (acetyl-transferring) E1 component subunit alpha [Bacteroidales bacterium]HOO65457.1 pyruvate dehydrogenase (acetyl-transferring) E1 component subunit alpha [Bacteroidales bacterium]HPE22691.1 pyruvate dehydrogenase (acetyl-transferring) E1 component subunit alpha [Bacteroidales bacterium]HPJ03959.1 pyruvate dehydrogenase (acetyl-transferring) E1 component subu